MIRVAIACALLLLGPAAEAGALRGDPGRAALCTGGTVNRAALPDTCIDECKKAADLVCAAPAPAVAGAAAANESIVAGTSWQGAVVTGLGNFLGDRAQKEVEAWFERLVREHLCELETGKVAWFPHTCALIAKDVEVGHQLASPLVLEAVKQDLPSLVSGIFGYLQAHAPSPAVGAILGVVPWIAMIAKQLVAGENPLILLRDAAANPEVLSACHARADKTKMNGACLLVFAGITVDFYGPLVKSPRAVTLAEVKQLAVKLLAEGAYRCEILKAIAETADCSAPNADAQLPAALRPLIAATVITTEDRITLVFDLVTHAAKVNQYLASVFSDTPPSDETAREQIAHTVELLDPVWTDLGKLGWGEDPPLAFRVLHLATGVAKQEYRATVLGLVELAALAKVNLPAWASRLLPMVTDILEAKSAGDVSAALDRAAAPIGGWRLKRTKPLLSISALVGGGVGYEAPFRSALGSQALGGGWAGGLMAPIGFEGSIPLSKSSSLGLLLSVLDVGQVTWARIEAQDQTMEDAGTKRLPDASLSQVLSLGGYLVLGLGDSPFTIGAGASIAPELRSYTYDLDGVPTDRSVTVWRAGLFVAVDVTVFPLF